MTAPFLSLWVQYSQSFLHTALHIKCVVQQMSLNKQKCRQTALWNVWHTEFHKPSGKEKRKIIINAQNYSWKEPTFLTSLWDPFRAHIRKLDVTVIAQIPGGSLGGIRLGLLNFRFICSLSSLNNIMKLKWHRRQIRYRCHYSYCLTFLFISFLDLKFSMGNVLCVWCFHIICVNSIMTQTPMCVALNQQQILEL